MPVSHAPAQNRLLAALSEAEFEPLAAAMELVRLRLGEILYEPDGHLEHAYFPTSAIISLYYVARNGASAESAGVGNEGMVGVSLFMGGDTTSSSAMVQTAGHAYRLEARVLQQAFKCKGKMRDSLLRYALALIDQVSQTAACNRHHSLQQQLCRCLLLNLDRTYPGQFVTTLQLISGMLGVSREAVGEAAEKLQQAGLIRVRRAHLTVLERTGLERLACECYGAEKAELNRLLPDPRDFSIPSPH